MKCENCAHELQTTWVFCPLCGNGVSPAQVPPPPPSGQTPNQRLIDLRKSLIKLGDTCSNDSPVRTALANIVVTVDEVIQAVAMLSMANWRDQNSAIESDMQRELQRVREVKPSDEKGPHHITMKRLTGF